MVRSYTTLRDSAIAALGEGAYRAVFSIVSLAVIVWLVMAYKDAPYVATWGLMLPAFLLAVIGLTTPNPTSVGQEGRAARSPKGIVGLDRPEGMLDLAAVLRADNGVDVSEGKIAPHVNTFGDQPSTFGAERLPMCMAAQLFA